MANRSEDLTVNIKAKTDQAERAVGDLERDINKLDDKTVDLRVEVKNGRDIDELLRKTQRLDHESADILLKTNAKGIEADIRKLIRQVDKLDADDPTITAHTAGIDSLRRDLGRVNDEIDKINRKDVSPGKGAGGGIAGLVSKFTSGMQSMAASVGLPAGALAGLGAAAGTAALAVGKAVLDMGGKFSDLGVEVGKFSDATGTTTEFASQLIEVSGDIGIGADQVEGAIGKMNKTLGNSPGKFAEYGVAIAHAKDGTTDVEQTFFNVVQRLQEIPDAGQRAAAGAALFGKSWTGIAELVMTDLDDLKANMKSVSEEKTFNQDEVDRAKKWRDSMDSLHDSIEDVQLAIGDMVVEAAPALKILGGTIEGIADQVKLTKDVVSASVEPWQMLGDKVSKTFGDDSLNGLIAGAKLVDGWKGSLADLRAQLLATGLSTEQVDVLTSKFHKTVEDLNTETDQAANYVDELGSALDDEAAALEESGNKAKAAADAHLALIDATATLADQEREVADATKAADEARANTVAVAKDHTKTLGDLADAVDREAQSGIDAAKQVQSWSDAVNVANEGAVDATDHVDSMNASLIDQAHKSSPAARQSVVDYIATLNKIPPEKASEILALIDQGKLDEANRKLADASAPRDAAVKAEAETAQANRDLDQAARDRTAKINVTLFTHDPELWALSHPSGSGPPSGRSAMVPVPASATLVPTTTTVAAAPMALAAPIVPPVVSTTLVINAGVVTDAARLARSMMRAQRRTERLAGKVWAER